MTKLATAKTLERLIKYISDYWGGATVSLHEEAGKTYVHNLNGRVSGFEVVKYRGGFMFIHT